MASASNVNTDSEGEQDWTKVEFVERRRSPYTLSGEGGHSKQEIASSGEAAVQPPGAFPSDAPTQDRAYTSGAETQQPPPNPQFTSRGSATSGTNPRATSGRRGQRTARPRQCRICLDIVHPTVQDSTIPNIPGIAQVPRFVYEDPELGRLISPCKCRGSARYVHEGCLKQWRTVSSNDRNYYKCPTCGYKYRLERLNWATFVQSTAAQLLLTLVVFAVAIFFLGFIADPIINLYLDPWSLVGWGWTGGSILEPIDLDDDGASGWQGHFFKGVASLGVLGFLKLMVASPLQFFRFRVGGGNQGGRVSGRDRMESLSWIVILVGIATTLYGIYTGVRAFSRRLLSRTAERVLDVGGNDDDDDEDDD